MRFQNQIQGVRHYVQDDDFEGCVRMTRSDSEAFE
jgi:hypothetical protein